MVVVVGAGRKKPTPTPTPVYAGRRRKTESIQNGFIIINYSNAPGVGPYTKYVEDLHLARGGVVAWNIQCS